MKGHKPKHKRRSFLKQASVGVASTAFLAGCMGGDGQDNDNNNNDDTNDNTGTSSPDEANIQTGGEVALGVEADVVELDPLKTSAYSSFQLLENIYEKLIYLDENLEPQPMLAKDWSSNDDQTEWTFNLQEGVMFHSPVDREFTADDVVFTIERAAAEETGYPFRSSFTPISEVTADDDYTVTFKFDKPYAPFLVKLSRGYIMPREADEEDSFDPSNKPTGTGPFTFVEHQSKSHTQLEAFGDYWQTDENGNQLPYLDSVRYRVMPEGSARMTNLKTNEIQLTQSVPGAQADGLENENSLEYVAQPGTSHNYIGYQTDKSPTSDIKFRQAMSWAISQEEIIQGAYFGYATPTHSTIPPASPFKQYIDIENPHGHDVDKAKQLLDESEYNGEPIEFIAATTYPTNVSTAQIVQDAAENIGVNLEINKLEWGTLINRVLEGDYQMMPLGWSGLVEPDSWMYLLFHSGEAWNFTMYENEEVDQLLEDARTEIDQEKRGELYNQAANIIHEEAPYTNICFTEDVMAWQDSVHGFIPYPNAVPRFNRVWIEQ